MKTPPPRENAAEAPPPLTSSERRALLEAETALAEAKDPLTRKASAATKFVLAVFGGGGFTWPKASVWIAFLVVLGASARTYLTPALDSVDPVLITTLTRSVSALAQAVSRLECVVIRSRDPVTAPTADTYCLDRWPLQE